MDLMDAERETRVETLIPGDRFRWMGTIYTVTATKAMPTGLGMMVRPVAAGMPPNVRVVPQVMVSTDIPARWGGTKTLLFPRGHFLAADPIPRP